MTEDEARHVLLLQSRESAMADAMWSAEDRSWATRQAVATVGEGATPERFVVARAVVALQRLLPRDRAALRWLSRRGWHPAWVGLAMVLAFAAGVLADQLGPPQRVNLLAPAVWAVVVWNLLVYLGLLLPLPTLGLRDAIARLGSRHDDSASALWLRHGAALMGERAALVLHAAAAALALGLVASLYLRGLVLDYRAGWQSTFLDAAAVQQTLKWLLAPAAWFTGIAVPDVAPLRVGPGGDASASAAPWIHLYAATLLLVVALPRCLLALRAGWRAGRQSSHFPLPLDGPYFAALHPLMRPGLPRTVALLWLPGPTSAMLFGCQLRAIDQPQTLLRSDEGDELELRPAPPALSHALVPMTTVNTTPWWARWRRVADPMDALRAQTDAVLLVTTPGAPHPPWLATLGRPVVVLVDGAVTEPEQLSLHDLAEGWLADGRLMRALQAALPDDPRLPRLAAAWTARQQERFDGVVTELADTLARLACQREHVAEEGLMGPRAIAAEAARQALLAALDSEWRASGERLALHLGLPAPADDGQQAVPAAAAALRARVGEGKASVVGGMLGGALMGLKADLLAGGLTMGAGAVAGGVIGAIGAAGAARGLNAARGTERSFVAWNDEALAAITQALLQRALVMAYEQAAERAHARLLPALAERQAAMAALWRPRAARGEEAGDAQVLAARLRQPLADAMRQALT